MCDDSVINKERLTVLAGGLLVWTAMQREISAMVPASNTEAVTNEQVTTASLALIGEVFELAQELGWKNWKENPEMTEAQVEKVTEEFADVMAFFGQLAHLVCYRCNLTPADLAKAYFLKSLKNVSRFRGESGEEGYVDLRRSYVRR